MTDKGLSSSLLPFKMNFLKASIINYYRENAYSPGFQTRAMTAHLFLSPEMKLPE
jgi:hypothetical protein